jgi:hypothetical protein
MVFRLNFGWKIPDFGDMPDGCNGGTRSFELRGTGPIPVLGTFMNDKQELIDRLKKAVPESPFIAAILDENKQVKPVYFIEAVFWGVENPDANRVAKTQVGKYEVSTIFSIVSLNGSNEDPEWFETMVFSDKEPYTFNRYRTYVEAQRGHKACVRDLKRKT